MDDREDVYMNTIVLNSRFLVLAFLASPLVLFGAYIAWLVVPVVLKEVVPEVVCAVIGS